LFLKIFNLNGNASVVQNESKKFNFSIKDTVLEVF